MPKIPKRRLHVTFYEIEDKILRYMEDEGLGIQEYIRSLVRADGRKILPKPTAFLLKAEVDKNRFTLLKAKQTALIEREAMSAEDYATNVLKAKIGASGKNAIFCPITPNSAESFVIPLIRVKRFAKSEKEAADNAYRDIDSACEWNDILAAHFEVIEHRLILFGGKIATESHYKACEKLWQQLVDNN